MRRVAVAQLLEEFFKDESFEERRKKYLKELNEKIQKEHRRVIQNAKLDLS